MNPCENCLSLNRFPGSDVEIKGEPLKEVQTCPFYPDGIPEEIQTGQRTCEFQIVD